MHIIREDFVTFISTVFITFDVAVNTQFTRRISYEALLESTTQEFPERAVFRKTKTNPIQQILRNTLLCFAMWCCGLELSIWPI